MLGPSRSPCSGASMRRRCWRAGASWPPTASANCPTTRCSTSGATSRRAATPGCAPVVFDAGGVRFGVLICEDAWFDEPAQAAVEAGAQLLCVLNASPFHLDKAGEREARMSERARATGRPLVYSHLVGGQDEVVFDGASFAVDAQGRVAARAPAFESGDADAGPGRRRHAARRRRRRCRSWRRRPGRALVTGVRDYLGKNGFPGAIIGLSGGVDSALVLAIAVDALGADRVRTVMMPSPYTADISWIDARDMADAAGRALRRDRHRADVRCLPHQPGAAVRRPGRGRDRREHPGPHPRHAADGAVQQDRRASC